MVYFSRMNTCSCVGLTIHNVELYINEVTKCWDLFVRFHYLVSFVGKKMISTPPIRLVGYEIYDYFITHCKDRFNLFENLVIHFYFNLRRNHYSVLYYLLRKNQCHVAYLNHSICIKMIYDSKYSCYQAF